MSERSGSWLVEKATSYLVDGKPCSAATALKPYLAQQEALSALLRNLAKQTPKAWPCSCMSA